MTQEQSSVKRNLKDELSLVFVQNPLLVTGLVLAPAIMGSFTLKNGAGLSLVFGMVTIPVLVLASFLGGLPEKVPVYVKNLAYVLLAALMLIPARWLAQGIAPNLFDSLGMYFSMVALNTVWIVRTPQCQEKKPHWALLEGVCHTVGFAVGIMAVSAVRELLAYGTLWGYAIPMPVKFPAVAYGFAGFVFMGVAQAALRWIMDRIEDTKNLVQRQKSKWEASR